MNEIAILHQLDDPGTWHWRVFVGGVQHGLDYSTKEEAERFARAYDWENTLDHAKDTLIMCLDHFKHCTESEHYECDQIEGVINKLGQLRPPA